MAPCRRCCSSHTTLAQLPVRKQRRQASVNGVISKGRVCEAVEGSNKRGQSEDPHSQPLTNRRHPSKSLRTSSVKGWQGVVRAAEANWSPTSHSKRWLQIQMQLQFSFKKSIICVNLYGKPFSRCRSCRRCPFVPSLEAAPSLRSSRTALGMNCLLARAVPTASRTRRRCPCLEPESCRSR